MKFQALREDLVKSMQLQQHSVSSRSVMPILTGTRMEAGEGKVCFASTDLESYTLTSCPANVEESGVAVVSHKIFSDLLRDLKDEKLYIAMQGNEMVIEGQDAQFKLYTMPNEDFPNLPEVGIRIAEVDDCKSFISSIVKAVRSASKDEKRPTLMGILLELKGEGIKMVSTDSYRLTVQNLDGSMKVQEEGSYIVPAAALQNLSRMYGGTGSMEIYRDENRGQLRFHMEDADYFIRLIEGKFPKYEQFIPEDIQKKVELSKERFLGALKRTSLVNTTVKMDIASDRLVLSSESRDIGEGRETLECRYNGDPMVIAFNSKFLEDGIMGVEEEEVTIVVNEPLKPGLVKGKEGDDYLYVIMPIRI